MSAVEEYRGAREYVTGGTHWVQKPLAEAALAEMEAQAEHDEDNMEGLQHALVRANQQYTQAEAERAKYKGHIEDIAAHATPFGDIPDEPGFIGTYLLTAGALHRALGTLGHTMPSCQADAAIAELEAENNALHRGVLGEHNALMMACSHLETATNALHVQTERAAQAEAELAITRSMLRLAFEDAYPMHGDTYNSGGIYRKWLADLRARAEEGIET